MKKIKIVTDSTVDLQPEVLNHFEIEMIPLSIHVDGENFLDRVDITPEEFIEKMALSKELPKSSQPSVGAFLELYNRLAEEGYEEIISIHMSAGLSGTVTSAESAANLATPSVTVINSDFISRALSFQVLEAAKLAQAGKSRDEIVGKINEVKNNTRLFVVVDTLENLIKGGRIGKGKALIGSLLNIKPIAEIEEGVYSPKAKARSKKQVVKILTEYFVEDVKGKNIKGVGIAHANGYEYAEKLKEAIKEQTGFEDVEIVYTTPVISTHTGPGAIGFSYYFA